MICDNCAYKSDCQLYGRQDECVYKKMEEIDNSAKNISNIINDAEDNDPEFYEELKAIFNT